MWLISQWKDAWKMGVRRGGLRWLFRRNKGKSAMSEERIISDALTSLLEDLIHRNVITGRRAQYWAERLGKGAGLEHLLPRRLRGEELKKAIRWRLHNTSIDLYKPASLPDRRRRLSDIFQAPPF